MGGGLLLLTLIAVYIVVYWLMAAEKNPLAKYSGILAFIKDAVVVTASKKKQRQDKPYLKSKPDVRKKWKPRNLD